jgi:tetratricopeptide (TPR) repeat protein
MSDAGGTVAGIDPQRSPEQLKNELAANLERLALQPDDLQLNVTVAHLMSALGQHQNALPYYERATTIEPGNGDAWYALGVAQGHCMRLDPAERSLRRAIELGRDDGIVRASLASILQRNRLPEAAIEEAMRALQSELDPELRLRLESLIGSCYAMIGDYEGALVHLQNAAASSPDSASTQHNLGVVYFERGNYEAALRHFANATRLAPERPDAWRDLGRAAHSAGDLAVAHEALERAIALGMDDSGVHLDLASVYDHLAQPATAMKHARRALRSATHPRDRSFAFLIVANSALQMGHTQNAFNALQNAVAADPTDGEALYRLGEACLERGQWEAAHSHLRRAAELKPESGGIWYCLARAAIERDDLEEAQRAFETALGLGVDDAELRVQLAWIYRNQEAWEPAIRTALPALDLTDDVETRTSLHRILGACYQATGDPERELRHLQEAVHGTPDDADLRYLLGVALGDQGDFPAALPHLEAAVALSPQEGEYRLALAQALIEVARFGEATRLLQALLGTDLQESAQLILVWCDVLQQEPGPAVARARKEVEVRPQSGLAWAGMALALFAAGESQEAQAALDRALALAPDDTRIEAVTAYMLPAGDE